MGLSVEEAGGNFGGAVIWRGLGGQGHISDFRVQALVPAWEIREGGGWNVAQTGEAGGGQSAFLLSQRRDGRGRVGLRF